MESIFSPITDVTRLKKGDIIVIPSELSRRQKRLHLKPSSLSKLGISYGFTRRSYNTESAVLRMLTADSGKSRAMFISEVQTWYVDSRANELQMFTGNNVSGAPQAPVISAAWFHELPYGGDPFTRFERLFFINNRTDNAVELLKGKMLDIMFFYANSYYNDKTNDSCITEVFDSRHAHEDGKERKLFKFVPCTRNDSPKGIPLTDDGIRDFVTSSNIFDHSKADGRSDCEIFAPKKFFVEYARRGARFYRPTDKFFDVVMAKALMPAFLEYCKTCRDILKSAEFFMTSLKNDMTLTKEKISHGLKIHADLKKIAADKTVETQFKEIMK